MNTTLVDCLFSLISGPYKEEFTLKQFSNPNMTFRHAFPVFLDNYRATLEHDGEENKNRMKAPWSLQDGWLVLQKWINDGIIFSLFA